MIKILPEMLEETIYYIAISNYHHQIHSYGIFTNGWIERYGKVGQDKHVKSSWLTIVTK